MKQIDLLHGSEYVIEKPNYGKGNIHNDYGPGFYCTQDEDLAAEWACKNARDGYVNKYRINCDKLKIFDFCDGTHNVLEWIATLLKNRTFRINGSLAAATKDYIIDNFSVDISNFDLIRGYRADDSYFQYAESFVENALSIRGLSQALYLGNMGIQMAVISQKGFDKLNFVEAQYKKADEYYPRYLGRDYRARKEYKEKVSKAGLSNLHSEIFAVDILREEIKREDERIQRIILK